MATTTNFGWTTPDDTDLVKDGAAAIRTALGGVDTSFVDLKGGTTGQILSKASGTDLDYSWVAAPSGGKVVQIVSATYAVETVTSGTTFIDSGLTATITPTSASNKVLVFVSQQGCYKSQGNANNGLFLRLLRASTNIASFLENGLYTETTLRLSGFGNTTYVLDTPATTSATTYKTQFKNGFAAAEVGVQKDSAVSSIVLMEVTP
jgi:hypothetical protein